MRKTAALIFILLLIVVFSAIFGTKAYQDRRAAAQAAAQSFPPASVETAVAHVEPWSNATSVVGSLEAVSGTEITAQIAGNVTRIAFASGARVRRGELLVQLDDSSQRAQLQADEATLQLATTSLKRARDLYAQRAGSQADLQQAEAALGTARAAVAGDHATLAKLAITAPFSGTVGIRQVSLGQYVSPGTAIVDLQSNGRLLLDFALPQSALTHLATGQKVTFSVNAFPGRTFEGPVTAIGARVDPATRTIAVQATLANPDGTLRPGLYGDVHLALGAPREGVVVASGAITYSTFGDTVYVVERKDAQHALVHRRTVQVQDQRGGKVLIASGLEAGDEVVTAGQNKLFDGARVAPQAAPQAPAAKAAAAK